MTIAINQGNLPLFEKLLAMFAIGWDVTILAGLRTRPTEITGNVFEAKGYHFTIKPDLSCRLDQLAWPVEDGKIYIPLASILEIRSGDQVIRLTAGSA